MLLNIWKISEKGRSLVANKRIFTKFSTYFPLIFNFRRVVPSVQPGYLAPLVPDEAPKHPENWQEIMKDIERVIMPGVEKSLFSLHNFFPNK